MSNENMETRVHFRVIRYMHESGIRLQLKALPMATSCVIYHMFYKENSLSQYDPYMIAMSALYLAGKIEEQHLRLRDVINVCYRTLHKSKPPLEISDHYWALRGSVAQCELFLLRMLNFKVVFIHPHKFLLHYMKTLKDWFQEDKWQSTPVAKTAWALLRDSYHGIMCLQYKPQHIAIAMMYFALQCYGIEVPHDNRAEIDWWKVFDEDVKLDIILDIISQLIALYDFENTVS